MSRSRVLLIAVTVLFHGLAFAQDSRPESAPASAPAKAAEKGAWDVSNPPGNRRAFDLLTSEGTWMSLDVSPDGKDIVFDLLGDLWTMPITGGDATLLRGGIPFETQPRFSKDGRFIAFTSDAGGGDNIWIMDRDGKNARQLTKENYRLVNNARWMPSGDFIVAKKHFSSHRSLGSGEMWMYRVGGGEGMQLTTKRTEQKDVGEPEISPDGRFVFFSEDTTPGGEFEYNKNPHETIYSIRRLDLTTGELKTILDLTGGAVRPTLSPDGKLLAFVHRMRLQSVLAIYDIEKGTWRDIYDQLDHDQQETWAIFGVYPGFAWTPDGRSIVIWAKGGLQKIDVATKGVTPIPFKAAVHLDLTETVRSTQTVSSPEFDVKVIRRPEISPDGRWALFSALGHTYIKKMPDGSPVRVTDQTAFEFQPTFSPDSVSLVHVTWDDRRGGALEFVFIDENRERRTITTEPGHYVEPVFSPDGKKVAFRRTNGDGLRGVDRTAKAGIYVLDLATGETRFVTANGTDPHFSADQKALYLTRGAGDGARLVRYALDGTDPIETPIAQSGMATEILLSPDEKWIAWVEGFQVYVAPFVRTGRELGLAPAMGQLPVKKCSEIGGEFLSFSADSTRLRFSLGAKLTEVEPAKLIGPLALTEAPKDQPKPNVVDLSFRARTDVPESTIVFDHATVLTMKNREIIADGKIVVRGEKIVAVGTSSDVKTPEGAIVRDLGGMIVAPGFVDVHSHMGRASEGVSPQSSWALLANLAFGVTTVHDPSADTKSVFAESELVKAGLLQGPRVFSTGTILYGAEGNFKAVINSIDDARTHLKRLHEWGAFSVKSYNQPRREQRQQVIAAARELSMEVVPEGGSTLFWNLTHIIDGHTTVEHALPVAPLYEDAVQLFARSGTGYTPTLIVGYGGLWGENYWYAHTPVWENARLMNFVPRSIVDAKSIRRPIAPEEDYNHFRLARTAKRIKDAGGLVELGAHGQIQGLGAHWELWMFAQGGMSPMEALESASLDGARALGLDREIGSIEAGKLADLVFWPGAKSPLENIRNSDSLQWVMKGGRLYDAMSLDQILPEAKPRRPGPAIELLGRENLVGGGCTCEGHSH